jgi:hypothetical protein
MGIYPDVTPGQSVQHSARRENEINALLKAANPPSEGRNFARSPQSVIIQAYNATTAAISPGRAVQIDITGSLSGDAFPAVAFDEEDTDAPFGVFSVAVAKNGIAPLILSGPASVVISGSTGGYAKPLEDGTFERGNEGVRILHLSGGTNAIVLLGDYKKNVYEAGEGINSDDITGGTISLNLIGVGGCTVSPVVGSTNGQMQVYCSGSTGGGGGGGDGLDYPPYSALCLGSTYGLAPEYGLGHTFILPVKAGAVGFYDDGGGAIGIWTNIDGSTSQYIENQAGSESEPYTAPEDGWLRISVVDQGLAPGKCLSFFSSTGGFPIYKYGSFGGSTVTPYAYTGSFAVANFDKPSTPGEPVVVEGQTIGIGIAGETVAHCVKIYDTDNRNYYNEYAGYVHIGQDKYRVSSYMTTYSSGQSVYLVGTFDANNDLSLEFKTINGYFPTINANQFCVRVCYEAGGKMIQAQYGDIVQPSRFPQNLSATVDGGTATVSLSGSTSTVKITGGTNATITSGENGEIVLNASGGGDGIGYPDYIALAGGTASNALGTITDDDYEEGVTPVPGPSSMPQNPKLGITYFLPVPAGAPIKYYASAAVLVRFAPVSGGGHFYYDLSNEMEWTPNSDGWLRISILDDGSHSSDCIRLYVGGEEWSDAVPLYKCGTFQGGATGINASVSGHTASITLTGGSGSVKMVGSGSVQISGGSNGEVIIHGSTSGGGGGGFYPAWSTTGHTDVIPITDGSGQGYTANADGWLFACAFFDPLEDRLKFKTYDAHVVVGNAPMKIAELKLPGGTPFIKVGNVKYTRDADEDWSSNPYAEHPYYSYFAWSANDTTIYTSNVAPDVGETTYTYDYEDEEFVDTEQEVQETNAATFAVCMGSGSPIPVKAGSVIKYVVTADGRTFYSRRTPPPCFCVFYSSNPPAAS